MKTNLIIEFVAPIYPWTWWSNISWITLKKMKHPIAQLLVCSAHNQNIVSSKKGVLGNGHSPKRGVLRNGLGKREGLRNWCCTKRGFLVAYLLITFNFWWGHVLWQINKWGIRNEKRGVFTKVRKGGWGVFTAAHTSTGHICECPPPPTSPVASMRCLLHVDLTSGWHQLDVCSLCI